MQQPDSSRRRAKQSGWQGRARAAAYVTVALSTLAVMATVGFLRPAAWSAPMPADPTTEIAELLLADGFSDSRHQWQADSAENRVYVENGELHLIVQASGSCTLSSPHAVPQLGDFAFQLQARKVSGPGRQYGLIFGSDEGRFYVFWVTEDGFYGLTRWTGQQWVPIVDCTHSPRVNQANGTNTLTVICKGPAIELHLNGRYLDTVVADSDTNGSVGLYAGAQGVHVAFDNLRLFGLR